MKVSNNNWTKEPHPIQSFQSWQTKFENIRRYEAQEREREIRRAQEHSSDGLVEALVVVGFLAMVLIPILIWLYYKSGICKPRLEERHRRYSVHSQDRLTSPTKPYYRTQLQRHTKDPAYITPFDSMPPVSVSPLKNSGIKCANGNPSSTCTTKDEIRTSNNKTYRDNHCNGLPHGPENV